MRLGLLASLAGVALVVTGFTSGSTGRARFDPGNLIVAGTTVREQDPTGKIVSAFDVGGIARAAAFAKGTLYVAGKQPTLITFNPDGTRGLLDSFPDGFEITAMDADETHFYVATSDGRSLHQIHRFTLGGVGFFPVPVESKVASLAIASDGCSLFYATLERGIRRLNSCDETASSILISAIAASDIALLPDGTMLIAPQRGTAILRLQSDGTTLRRYKRSGSRSWRKLAVDQDGATFWAADAPGRLVRFSVSSGQVLKTLGGLGPVHDLLVVGAPHGPAASWPAKEDGSLELDGVPTLTGEGFVQQISGRPLPPEPCSPSVESTLHFETEGQAFGPYRGTFSSRETVRVGPQTIQRPSGPLGVPVGRLLSLDGSFSLPGTSRSVSGTLSLPRKETAPNTGACLSFENQTFPNAVLIPPDFPVTGYYRNIHARKFPYRATISSGGRAYVDRGDSALFTDEYYLTRPDGGFQGSVDRLEQTFSSRLVSVVDRFATQGVGKAHSVEVHGNRKTLTLRIAWKSRSDSFTLKGIAFHQRSSFRPNSERKLKPGKLKPGGIFVRTTRKGRTLKIIVTKLKPGELRFKVVPTRLNGTTTATTILENPGS
jgi:hypothetical protein